MNQTRKKVIGLIDLLKLIRLVKSLREDYPAAKLTALNILNKDKIKASRL